MQKFFMALALFFGVAAACPAHAATNPLIGGWMARENVPSPVGFVVMETTLVFIDDNRFSAQTMTPFGYGLTYVGTYERLPKRMIHLTVEDWEPKYFQGNPVLKPPGGMGAYSFEDARHLVVHDLYTGAVTKYLRVQ